MPGVAALFVVMSLINGFRVELFDKIVGLNCHAVVQGYNGQLRDWRTIAAEARALLGVTSAVPLIEQPLMATYNGRVEGMAVRGMHANDIRTTATIENTVIAGALDTQTQVSRTAVIRARTTEALGAKHDRDNTVVTPHGAAT